MTFPMARKKHAPTCCAMVSKCHAGGIFIAQFTRVYSGGSTHSTHSALQETPFDIEVDDDRISFPGAESFRRCERVVQNVLCMLCGMRGWQRFYAKSSEKQIEDNKHNKQHQTTRRKLFSYSFNILSATCRLLNGAAIQPIRM